MKRKLSILFFAALLVTKVFAEQYEHSEWEEFAPWPCIFHVEAYCPSDKGADKKAEKIIENLTNVSWTTPPSEFFYTTIGSLYDYQYLIRFGLYFKYAGDLVQLYYIVDVLDKDSKSIYRKDYDDYKYYETACEDYKDQVSKFLKQVYPNFPNGSTTSTSTTAAKKSITTVAKSEEKSAPKTVVSTPNFKVSDYIKELDATVFKIDGNNVTLYHRENRDVTYSALETFCKNYQKDGFSGWRLPTIDEMNYMYTYRINSGTYWASTAKPEEHWAMDLVSGKWYKDYYTKLNVFVVKTLDVATINDYFAPQINEPEKKIDEELRHNFKFGDYMPCGTVFNVVGNKVYVFNEVSDYWYSDGNVYYAGSYPFAGAKECCKNSTTGGYTDWRLPTAQELNLIYTNRNAILASFGEKYWTSSPGKGGKPQYLYFGNGTWITGTELTTCSVIAVREFDF